MPILIPLLSLFISFFTMQAVADSLVDEPLPAPPRANLGAWMESRGFTVEQASDKEQHFSKGRHRIECRSPSRKVTFDQMELWFHDGVVADSNGVWTAASADLRAVLAPLLDPLNALPASPKKLIVLDAGHGGIDEGAKGQEGSTEKERTLDIALKVETKLKTLGYEVLLTRDTDHFLELEDRARYAGKVGAAIFVSIHLNKSSNSNARGIETYVLTAPGFRSSNDPNGQRVHKRELGHEHLEASMVLGGAIHKHLVQNNSMRDRGIKRARFVVLREAPCPAVLLECGFLSNPEEEKLFAKDTFRDYIALRISNGIHQYMAKLNKAQIKKSLLQE